MPHTRHFVKKIVKIFGQIFRPVFVYPNTIHRAKKTNTEYRILFGIEIIRIQNTNIIIRSKYSNSIRIPNYSSHPGRVCGCDCGVGDRLGKNYFFMNSEIWKYRFGGKKQVTYGKFEIAM